MTTIDTNCVLEHHKDPDRPRRALPGLYVCPGHRTGLARALLELPGMYDRLVERHTARSPVQSEIRAGGHHGLSLSDPVALLRGNIVSELGSRCRMVAEERAFHQPEPDVRSMCHFLIGGGGRMLDWCLAQPWAEEFHNEVDHLHREAFGLLYPRGRRRFELGDCIEVTACDVQTKAEQRCLGRMVATLTDPDDESPTVMWCTDCGLEVPKKQWIKYGLRYQSLEEAS